jgi:hypothetical protein
MTQNFNSLLPLRKLGPLIVPVGVGGTPSCNADTNSSCLADLVAFLTTPARRAAAVAELVRVAREKSFGGWNFDQETQMQSKHPGLTAGWRAFLSELAVAMKAFDPAATVSVDICGNCGSAGDYMGMNSSDWVGIDVEIASMCTYSNDSAANHTPCATCTPYNPFTSRLSCLSENYGNEVARVGLGQGIPTWNADVGELKRQLRLIEQANLTKLAVFIAPSLYTSVEWLDVLYDWVAARKLVSTIKTDDSERAASMGTGATRTTVHSNSPVLRWQTRWGDTGNGEQIGWFVWGSTVAQHAVRQQLAMKTDDITIHEPAPKTPPHLLMVIGDDVGVSDVPWPSHSGTGDPTVHAPTLLKLAMSGIRLDAHYVWIWCAPSRGALLSGKHPNLSGFTQSVDYGATTTGQTTTALDKRLRLLPAFLKMGPRPYSTHMLGKYHLGFATPAHMPKARGFDSFLGYLGGTEDYYWKSHPSHCGNVTDFWHSNATYEGPARDPSHFPAGGELGEDSYSAFVYTREAVKLVRAHAGPNPLFLLFSSQNAHEPSQTPRRFFEMNGPVDCVWDPSQKHRHIACEQPAWVPEGTTGVHNCYCTRLLIKAQVSALDEAVANITRVVEEELGTRWLMVFVGASRRSVISHTASQ